MLHDESALRPLCLERHIHQTRHGHIHTASSCAICIAHRYVHRLLAAAKQHDVEDDPRQWCTLYQMVGGGRWVPSHLAL